MKFSFCFVFSFFMLLTTSYPTMSETNAMEKADSYIAELVGKNNVNKAKIGAAAFLSAAGILSVWCAIRKCPCLQDRWVQEQVPFTQSMDPSIRLHAELVGRHVPSQVHGQASMQVLQQPGCCKRMLRCLFCIKSAQPKS